MHEIDEFLTPDQMLIFCHSVRKQDWAKTRVQSEINISLGPDKGDQIIFFLRESDTTLRK